MKVSFISVGRLTKEKGSHLLLGAIDQIARMRGGETSMLHIHVFGKGEFQEKFIEYAEKYDFVTYYGHRPKEEVLKVRKKCHFTLVASLFLETFGLTALDGISVGTPIVGFQKGGLAQFVEDRFALKEHKDLKKQTDIIKKKIVSLAKTYNSKKHGIAKRRTLKKYKGYVRESWFNHFERLLPKNMKRIMIVSDYKADIGGIENWLHIVVKNLKKEGYKIKFVGGENKPKKSWSLFFNLFKTAWNFRAGRRIKKDIKKFNPDIIRRHSVHRVLGWYPLSLAKKKTYRQWIMYHDFGLFHPYPSMVYNEKQLVESRTFRGFMREGLKKGWRHLPLLLAKWLSFKCIRKQLKNNINLHLVPSAYMLGSVTSKGYIGENAAIDVLPHFINPPK